jgi:hypothetical protein
LAACRDDGAACDLRDWLEEVGFSRNWLLKELAFEGIVLALARFIPRVLRPPPGAAWSFRRGDAMPKPESFPIDKIYVPVKRKKALKLELVQEIAKSILEIGQQDPILVRTDEDRFVLVEGLHRLEACKALGEDTIIGIVAPTEIAHHRTLSDSAEVEVERDKMARLRQLRLEKEAAEKLAAGAESSERLRTSPEKGIRNNLKATPGRFNRGDSASTPKTLSQWLTQQKRDGGRY